LALLPGSKRSSPSWTRLKNLKLILFSAPSEVIPLSSST
jgi:hypothetical protein